MMTFLCIYIERLMGIISYHFETNLKKKCLDSYHLNFKFYCICAIYSKTLRKFMCKKHLQYKEYTSDRQKSE